MLHLSNGKKIAALIAAAVVGTGSFFLLGATSDPWNPGYFNQPIVIAPMNVNGNQPGIFLNDGGVANSEGLQIIWNTGDQSKIASIYGNSVTGAGGKLVFATNSASSGSPSTAMTLDNNQNAIIQGNLTVGGSGGVTINNTGGNTPHSCVVTSTTASSSDTATVSCSAGSVATGGGCNTSVVQNIQITRPNPTSGTPTGWFCQTATTTTLTAYAICCPT